MKTIDELVAALRVEIGLAADDESQDVWLTARVQSVLAAMRNYCRRYLWPASQFRDAFLRDYRFDAQPSIDMHWMRRAVHLAEIPVQEILSVVSDGTPQDATEYETLSTGRLFRNDGTNFLPVQYTQQLLVDYVAGYVDLPADLYEVINGTVKKAWSTTDTGAGDAIGGNVEKLTVFDVGSVELAGTGGFYESQVKAADGGPILGPWAAQLDAYRDRGRGIGLPTGRDSVYVGAAPAAPLASGFDAGFSKGFG